MSAAGVHPKRLWRVWCLGILLLFCVVFSSCGPLKSVAATPTDTPVPREKSPITVKITNPGIKTAIAYVVETNKADSLDQDKLSLPACSEAQHISVWAPGYYISTFPCNGKARFDYSVSLEAINSADNPNYTWVDADPRTDATRNCANCHSGQSPNLAEYLEWNQDGHSKALTNPLFWTMYMGMDINSNSGPQTQWGISGDEQRIRLTPDAALPNYGPGYHLDYPGDNGNCIYCHVPAGLPGIAQGVALPDLINNSRGGRINVATEGVTCDVCHKAIDVRLDGNGLPYLDRQIGRAHV